MGDYFKQKNVSRSALLLGTTFLSIFRFMEYLVLHYILLYEIIHILPSPQLLPTIKLFNSLPHQAKMPETSIFPSQ